MRIFTLILFLSPLLIQAQSVWEAAGLPFSAWQIRCLYVDEEEDLLWVAGDIRDDGVYTDQLLLKYDGETWESYGHFDGQILDVQRYNGKIYAVGFFRNYNDITCEGVAVLEDDTFVEAVHLSAGYATSLRVIEDELYASGIFMSMNGEPCNKICTFDGEIWSPFEVDLAWDEDDLVSDIVKYDGHFFIGGNFHPNDWEEMDVFWDNGGEWMPAGPGLLGFSAYVTDFILMNNELFAAGAISSAFGNAGNGIQKWNGTDWESVSFGISGPNMSTSTFTRLRDYCIKDDLLILGGAFEFADEIPCPNLTVWNGEQFCCLGGDFFPVGALAIYHDTLYMGTGNEVDGVFVNHLAKYTGDWSFAECSEVSIEEQSNNIILELYPNPAQTAISIEVSALLNVDAYVHIYDAQGVLILEEVWPIGRNRKVIDVQHLKPGMYITQVLSSRGLQKIKWLKSE